MRIGDWRNIVMNVNEKLKAVLTGYIQGYKMPDVKYDSMIYYNRLIDKIAKYANVERRLSFDIYGLVKFYEIDIQEVELNLNLGHRVRKINGRCRNIKEGKEVIELNYTDNFYVKRYVLAHEFAHIILEYIKMLSSEQSETENMENYCLDPFFAQDSAEISADILASLMLLPYASVLEYMKAYCENLREQNQYPLEASEWINSLGWQSQLSSYHTIVAYQYVKHLICEFFESSDDECKEIADNLRISYAELIGKSR